MRLFFRDVVWSVLDCIENKKNREHSESNYDLSWRFYCTAMVFFFFFAFFIMWNSFLSSHWHLEHLKSRPHHSSCTHSRRGVSWDISLDRGRHLAFLLAGLLYFSLSLYRLAFFFLSCIARINSAVCEYLSMGISFSNLTFCLFHWSFINSSW